MTRSTKITLYVVACVLAAAAAFSFVSCDAPLNAEERGKVAAIDSRVDLACEDLKKLKSEAATQELLLVDEDPTNDITAAEAIEAIHLRYVDISAAIAKDLEARDQIISDAIQRSGDQFTGGAATAFPQFAPYILIGGSLITRLLATRSKEHLKDALEGAKRLNLGDFFSGVWKSLGYGHSNTDPIKVLGGAEAAAIAAGDPELARRIREFAARVEADLVLSKAGVSSDGGVPNLA